MAISNSYTCVNPGYYNGQACVNFSSLSNITYHILAGGYNGVAPTAARSRSPPP